MTREDDVHSALTEIFRDVFNKPDMEISRPLTAKDVKGWDSFKQIEIILGVEERFGVRLNTREIDNLKCVGDLIDVVLTKSP